MPAFMAEEGMPYWVELLSSDPQTSAHFYSELLGWSIEATEPGYWCAHVHGIPTAGIVEKPENSDKSDTWITYLYVSDVDGVLREIEKQGGRAYSDPMATAKGRVVVIADPSGAPLGLVETRRGEQERFVAAGEPGTMVWHELSVMKNMDATCAFYAEVFGWDIAQTENYAVALRDGAAFAGIRPCLGMYGADVPSFWQSFLGVEDLGATCARVPELGGEVLRDPVHSEFGLIALIADATGAVVTLTQSDVPTSEEEMAEMAISEGDSVL